LLHAAYQLSQQHDYTVHVGNILSSDLFYTNKYLSKQNLKLGQYGVLAIEMEAAALYYLGAKFGVQTLAMMTISDSLITQETTTSKERESSFKEMIILGFKTMMTL
jgi:purine-nucleoside phosphorylase